MTYEEAKKTALEKRFGSTALGILRAAERGAVNPYDYFGFSMRRSWSYAYFTRLCAAGLLRLVAAPDGRRGTNWYVLTD